MIVVAYAIAILLPLGFLYLIYSQDLFGQGKFKYVLLSFAWGLLAFGGAYGIASLLQWRLTVAFGSQIAHIHPGITGGQIGQIPWMQQVSQMPVHRKSQASSSTLP